jgi:hypothetical protein
MFFVYLLYTYYIYIYIIYYITYIYIVNIYIIYAHINLCIQGDSRRRLVERRTWQACKNAGVAAEKAWRQAAAGHEEAANAANSEEAANSEAPREEKAVRYARLMLLFFGTHGVCVYAYASRRMHFFFNKACL